MNTKIAIESYEAYNNGTLACKWFDVETTDYEEIEEFFKELHEEHGFSEDLELFIADYEGDFLGICGEHASIENVLETYQVLPDHVDHALLEVLIYDIGYSVEDAIYKLDEVYSYDSKDEYLEHVISEVMGVDEDNPLYSYIDYEKLERDYIDYDDTVHLVNDTVYVVY
jgi:uncharacterized protein YodC (DUF2158 family)